MSNLSDNELDKLSREAAEKYEPAENAQSWNKLEQLLDKNLGKPSPVPRLAKPGMPILYTGIILLAVATSYLLIKTIRNSQNFTPKINASNTPQSQGNNISRKDSSTLILKDKRDEPRLAERASDKTELADQKSAAGIKNNDQKDLPGLPKITSDQSPSNADRKRNGPLNNNGIIEALRPVRETSTTKRSSNQNADSGRSNVDKSSSKDSKGHNLTKVIHQYNQFGKSKPSIRNSNSGSSQFINGNSRIPASVAKNESGKLSEKGNITAGGEVDPLMDRVVMNKKGSSIQDLEDDDVKFAETPGLVSIQNGVVEINDSMLRLFDNARVKSIIIPSRHNNHGAFVDRSLQFGVLFAPEFSKVKYIYDNNRLGNSFGITLGYQLLSKLSINSGVIFSEKYFQAGEKQFHAPPGAAGSNNLEIEFVNASANVIDIPFNFRYDYFSDGNSTFFVNGGLSSYFMKKQKFDYYCHYNNGVFQSQGWVRPPGPVPSESNLFSIINLSTGFETKFSNSFSFQFEPYMKIPVQGVGFGKVDLSSYGIIMSLRYTPVINRGRH